MRRSRVVHVGLFVLAYVGWLAALFLIRYGVATAATPDVVYSQAELERARDTVNALSLLATLAWLFITLGPIANLVGYRTRDVWLALIPVYGVFFLAPKLIWRWASIPDRYWELDPRLRSPLPPPPPLRVRQQVHDLGQPAPESEDRASPEPEPMLEQPLPAAENRGPEVPVTLPESEMGPSEETRMPPSAAPKQPQPARERRRPRARYAWAAVATLIVAAAVWGAFELGQRGGTRSENPGTTSRPSPSPSVDTGPSPEPKPEPPAEVVRSFPAQARGQRIALRVYVLGDIPRCREGSFRGRIAYYFDCSDVAGASYEPYLMYVRLRNTTGSAIRVSLGRFVVVTRGGDSQTTVNVRADASSPEAFMAKTALLPPHSPTAGWIAFDGRTGFVPSRLSYVDRVQTLTVRFVGKHKRSA